MKKTQKEEYKAPQLKKFGDFRTLTLTKGVTDIDNGGTAKTRAHGGGGA